MPWTRPSVLREYVYIMRVFSLGVLYVYHNHFWTLRIPSEFPCFICEDNIYLSPGSGKKSRSLKSVTAFSEKGSKYFHKGTKSSHRELYLCELNGVGQGGYLCMDQKLDPNNRVFELWLFRIFRQNPGFTIWFEGSTRPLWYHKTYQHRRVSWWEELVYYLLLDCCFVSVLFPSL